MKYFSYFPQKIDFNISCKLSQETICMTFQSLFSEKNKKNIIRLSSAELVQRVDTICMTCQSIFWEK